MKQRLEEMLFGLNPRRSITFLTGAGISAESGIPTFRGEGGYWTVGSTVYTPQEIATWQFFQENPWEVWRWYLHRRGVCDGAEPNDAHRALVRLEEGYPRTFHLITQNIDGLHRLAGSSDARTYEVHGSGHELRCAARCTDERHPIPPGVKNKAADEPMTEADKALLACPRCGGLSRPHVLWFDESYEEALYRSETAMAAALSAAVLVTVGTSGATSLPLHAAAAAGQAQALLIDINPHKNPFQQFAESQGGVWLQGSATQWVPMLVDILLAQKGR
ncbi:MAG: NAD-dependent deacetylase [Myxococcota bacterium]|jgi:NAD-dependent deacetylase